MKKDTILSVIIISYKQKKYIKECIDSVLSQKTKYAYEVLLADDFSQDGTDKIMEEYAKKNKNVIYVKREHNYGATANFLDACSKSKGKYITCLEGDDYWCDDSKIDTLIEFLEENSDYIAASHLQEGRNLSGKVLGRFPLDVNEDYTINGIEDLTNGLRMSETATIYHNIYKNKEDFENIEKLFSLDDTICDSQIVSYLLSKGKVYVFAKAMMVYRMRNEEGETNYNSTHKVNEIQLAYLKINSTLDEFFDYKYNYYNAIRNSYTTGVAYDLLNFNFKDIKNFNKTLPKRYKWKIILLFPFNCFRILFRRLKGRR